MTARHGKGESGGVLTERWGWQPTAWLEDGLPHWRWRSAPPGLVTRRQMRAEGLAPGGRRPVARVVCRRGRRWAELWDRADLVAKRTPTPAQLQAVGRALAARRWCPGCRRDVGYCIPTSVGVCGRCDPPLELAAIGGTDLDAEDNHPRPVRVDGVLAGWGGRS